jgi:hypothetical protein
MRAHRINSEALACGLMSDGGWATSPRGDTARLATMSLHVAQVHANGYAISARGFNDSAANKLLVLIDGRSV